MGIILSIFISYVGIKESIECFKHIISGVVPILDSNFNDLVEYYTRLHRQTANPSSSPDWRNDCGQGYIAWSEDDNGNLIAGAIKFHGKPSNSTALLFSTKISSFGQTYSVEETPQENGDYRPDRYQLTKTKTIISDTSESFSIGSKNQSNSVISNPSVDRDYSNEPQSKLTWQYTPQSPTMQMPEIHFQSYDDEKRENITYSEDYLRSLDGIKFRPLQRSDPSGRRRSFRKRNSSSNSSKGSRESREDELKMFTSLEEAEFNSMNSEDKSGFGSTPNLPGRSYSRSRSREKSKERGDEKVGYADDTSNDNWVGDTQSKALPKLSSLVETGANNDKQEVNEEEDEVDFWANNED